MAASEVPENHPLYQMNAAYFDQIEHIPKHWLVRRCDAYESELKSCQSFGGRFHHIYVHGSSWKESKERCQNWQDNLDDCKQWVRNKDQEAFERIINRENKRIADRVHNHANNDTWKPRSQPPDDWLKPLPRHLQEMADGSKTAYFVQKYESQGKSRFSTLHRFMNKIFFVKTDEDW